MEGALVAARDARGIFPERVAETSIYMTSQAHHGVGKALHSAGLGELRQRLVPMDGRYRMDVSGLAAMVATDRDKGLAPWLVVASAGTNDNGAVDHIGDFAALAQREGLWLQLDAAFVSFESMMKIGRLGYGFQHTNTPFNAPSKKVTQAGEVTLRQAQEWLSYRSQEAPFYLWFHLFGPHGPYDMTACAEGKCVITRAFPRMAGT